MKPLFFHAPKSGDGSRISIAAYIEDGNLIFGASKCNAKDQFLEVTARNKALGRAKSQSNILFMTPAPEKNLGDFFLKNAKKLVECIELGHGPTHFIEALS